MESVRVVANTVGIQCDNVAFGANCEVVQTPVGKTALFNGSGRRAGAKAGKTIGTVIGTEISSNSEGIGWPGRCPAY